MGKGEPREIQFASAGPGTNFRKLRILVSAVSESSETIMSPKHNV